MENKLVHCYKCGAILFKLNEEEEFDVQVKCSKCNIEQRVVVEIAYRISVLPAHSREKEREKLSTI